MIKPTDNKLHVRVSKVSETYRTLMINQIKHIGFVLVSETQNYTNFYVFIDKKLNRAEQQNRLNKLFEAAGYTIK